MFRPLPKLKITLLSKYHVMFLRLSSIQYAALKDGMENAFVKFIIESLYTTEYLQNRRFKGSVRKEACRCATESCSVP